MAERTDYERVLEERIETLERLLELHDREKVEFAMFIMSRITRGQYKLIKQKDPELAKFVGNVFLNE